MTMARRLRSRLCGWLAVALLLAQWLTAAYACPSLQPPAASGALPPCHEAVTAADHARADPANPALCKAHCENERQAPSGVPVLDAPPASTGWFIVQTTAEPPLPLAEPAEAWQRARAGAPPGWPPLHLLLQVLRH